MATALPTMAVSLVYILWDACRRALKRQAPPPPPQPTQADEHLEQRLVSLTFCAKPLPRRR
jgi:hypothetical protein